MAMVPDRECRMPTFIGDLSWAKADIGEKPTVAAPPSKDFRMMRRCMELSPQDLGEKRKVYVECIGKPGAGCMQR
jgi:hypothetical protein